VTHSHVFLLCFRYLGLFPALFLSLRALLLLLPLVSVIMGEGL
jgi:hypothetical protein